MKLLLQYFCMVPFVLQYFYKNSNVNFRHGTKCAGIIAGGDNPTGGNFGVGGAFGAQISSKGSK